MRAAQRIAAAISGFSTVAGLVIGSAALVDAAGAPAAQSATATASSRLMPAPANIASSFRSYCITCHNDQLRTAGISLQGLDPGAVQEHGDVWEKVLVRLRAQTMPPRRPSASGRGHL